MRKFLLSSVFILSFAFGGLEIHGQSLFRILDLKVTEGGHELRYPWIGGLNNVMVSPIFLNNDTIYDLFLFDRKGNKILTFINEGTPDSFSFRYEPKYERMFPEIKAWALIVDYNRDGVSDIYAHVNTGIQVYEGSRNGDEISFTQASPLLIYGTPFGTVNIWVSIDDLPAVVDVNKDGDIDVLAFGLAENTVTYYENQAVENGYSLDTFAYKYMTNCWGHFAEGGLTNKIFLGACKNGGSPGMPPPSGGQGNPRHAGSTVTTFDHDGDGDEDLLLGDVGFDNLVFLENGGDSANANMVYVDSIFPKYDKQAAMTIFPAASFIDLDNDGETDMINSPFLTEGSENYGSIQYFKDIKAGDSAIFEHQTDSFLVTEVIDLGEGAVADMVDIDGDSLLDMIIGNYGYFNQGAYTSSLNYYKQVDDSGRVAFELVSRDLQSFSLLGLLGMHPTFGDIDSDGDMDMVLGEEDGFVHLFYNIAAPGNMANFRLDSPRLANIDVGQFSAPHLYDLDNDNDLDLLIGRKDGKISFYWNTGDANNPIFHKDSVNNFLGGIVTENNFFSGRSKPFVGPMDSTLVDYLFAGSNTGKILVYEIDPDSLRSGSFNQVSPAFGGLDEGGRAGLSIHDINQDTIPDFLIYNDRGGLSLYSAQMWDTNSIIQPPPDTGVFVDIPELKNFWSIYPNPAKDKLTLEMNFPDQEQVTDLRIVDVLGREVYRSGLSGNGRFVFDVEMLSDGLYVLELSGSSMRSQRRFIKE